MVPEIERYFDINRHRAKMHKPPRDYRLFIVGKEIFLELDEKARQEGGRANTVPALKERGYHSYTYEGVPVTWDEGIAGRGVTAIEGELLDALNEMRTKTATA